MQGTAWQGIRWARIVMSGSVSLKTDSNTKAVDGIQIYFICSLIRLSNHLKPISNGIRRGQCACVRIGLLYCVVAIKGEENVAIYWLYADIHSIAATKSGKITVPMPNAFDYTFKRFLNSHSINLNFDLIAPASSSYK